MTSLAKCVRTGASRHIKLFTVVAHLLLYSGDARGGVTRPLPGIAVRLGCGARDSQKFTRDSRKFTEKLFTETHGAVSRETVGKNQVRSKSSRKLT